MKKPEDKLAELVRRLQSASGDNLISVVLYGSAARDDFHETYSDVNLLVVLKEMTSDAFVALAPVLRWWSHEEHLRPPQFMTLDELRRSADVFAIELLDIQQTHKTLFGNDVVTEISVPMNLHRVEVEHELRVTLLRLRHHMLLHPDDQEQMRVVLAKSVSSVVTLLRHALIALGEAPPHDKRKLLEHAGEVFGFNVAPLRAVLELRDNPQGNPDLQALYHAYMSALSRIVREVDMREPKRQLQKIK